MNDEQSPQISVVLVTPDHYNTLRETLRHIRNQTVSDGIEVLIVAPPSALAGLDDSEWESFWAVQLIKLEGSFSRGRARAAGIHKARAPIVAFVEDHAYFAPGWGEATLEAHEGPWAAVGPTIANANPGNVMSWANFFILYGPWVGCTEGKISDDIPGENSSYKTHILREPGLELEGLLNGSQDSVMHRELRARGHRLYLDPKTIVYHHNFESLADSMNEHYGCGRSFAAARSLHWSAIQRMFFAGGSPLIPLVRFCRVCKDIQRSGKSRDLLPGIIPALMAGLITSAIGELVGYILGQGNAEE